MQVTDAFFDDEELDDGGTLSDNLEREIAKAQERRDFSRETEGLEPELVPAARPGPQRRLHRKTPSNPHPPVELGKPAPGKKEDAMGPESDVTTTAPSSSASRLSSPGSGTVSVRPKWREDSLEKAQDLAQQTLGGDMPEPLLYRWKHMDRAWAAALRGRAEHDLLHGALKKMWTQKELDDAEALVEAAAPDAEVPHQAKIAAKANSVLRCFENDPGAQKLQIGGVMTRPLQSMLNQVAQSDKTSVAFNTQLALGADTQTAQDLRKDASAQNLGFISGDNGKNVMASYEEMLSNLGSRRWGNLTEATKLRCAPGMINPMANAWRRAVFYFEDPRFMLFSCYGPSDERGAGDFNADLVADNVERMGEIVMAGCTDCLDDRRLRS